MPFLRLDLIEGRSEVDIRKIIAVIKEVAIETLKVPKHDRDQRRTSPQTVLNCSRTGNFSLQSGIGDSCYRSSLKARDEAGIYRMLVEKLSSRCGIHPQDVVVTFVTNGDEDWSFGMGHAQFLTGEFI